MSAYNAGNTYYNGSGDLVFNSNEVSQFTTSDDSTLQTIIDTLTTFVKKVGDTMGYLNVSKLQIYGNTGTDIIFSDGTIQNTAYIEDNTNLTFETLTFTEKINDITTETFQGITDIADIKNRTKNIDSVGLKTLTNDLVCMNCTLQGDLTFNYLDTNTGDDYTTTMTGFDVSYLKTVGNTITTIQEQINTLSNNGDTSNGGSFTNITLQNITFTDTINNIPAETFGSITDIADINDRTKNILSIGSRTLTNDFLCTEFVCQGQASMSEGLRVVRDAIFQQNLNIDGDLTFNYSDADTGIDYTTTMTGFDFGYLKTVKDSIDFVNSNLNTINTFKQSQETTNASTNTNLQTLNTFKQTQETTNASTNTNLQTLNTFKQTQETLNTSIGNNLTTLNDFSANKNPTFETIKFTNNNEDTTINTLSQSDYSNFTFYNMIDIIPLNSSFRNYYIGVVGLNTANTNHFCIGTNAGGEPEPDIIFSLSSTTPYFYGVKNPLVAVGTVHIYAGLSNNIPTGYLLCNGASISQTTFSKLFSVIGNTYLNGRTSSSTTFFLPDLRGMFVRGVGTNTTYSGVAGASNTGTYQTSSVENHFHYYQRPNNAINVSSGTGINSSVWDNQTGTSATSQETYNGTGTLMTDETRPHNISMNYIIKF